MKPVSEVKAMAELSTDSESRLIEKLVSSEVKMDLLVLFHNNPGLIDKTEAVARRIGRTAPQIEAGLKDLTELGVLRRKKFGNSEIIFFDQAKDNEIQQLISNRLLRGGKQ
jgi:hypothetical protein